MVFTVSEALSLLRAKPKKAYRDHTSFSPPDEERHRIGSPALTLRRAWFPILAALGRNGFGSLQISVAIEAGSIV